MGILSKKAKEHNKEHYEKDFSKMSQEELVLDYMQRFGSITTLEAFKDIGCTRLSAKIYNLKRKGYVIYDEWLEMKNRYGKTVYFKKYYL